MLPDWALEVGVVASVLSLLSLQPILYRFLVAWLWPYSVEFDQRSFAFAEGAALAGIPSRLLVTIRNRTPEAAYFQISYHWFGVKFGESPPVEFRYYRDFPTNEPVEATIRLGPLERQRILVNMTPISRGDFHFDIQLIEFFHADNHPLWMALRRKLLRMKSPKPYPLVFRGRVDLDVRNWAVPREKLMGYIGRELTSSEISRDDGYVPKGASK
jgi:hypothetical protein